MRIRHRDVETRGNAQSIQASSILLLFFGSQEQQRPPTYHTLWQILVMRLNTESQSSPGEAGNCEDVKDSEVVFALASVSSLFTTHSITTPRESIHMSGADMVLVVLEVTQGITKEKEAKNSAPCR
jgi:hypothetical protein